MRVKTREATIDLTQPTVVYNNCVFTNSFKPNNDSRANVEIDEEQYKRCVEFVVEETGLEREWVENVLKSSSKFYNDQIK